VKTDAKEKLALQQAKRFQLYEAKELKLAAGDRLRITRNGFSAETRRGQDRQEPVE